MDRFVTVPETVAELGETSTRSVLSDGTVEWTKNSLRHKLDGPAVERPDGVLEWWSNGERCPAAREKALTLAYEATCMDDLRALRMSEVDGWVALVLLWNENLSKPGELTAPSRVLLTEIATA